MGKSGEKQNNNTDILAQKLAELFIFQLDFQKAEKKEINDDESKTE
jgi:hypothetical protein